MASFKQFTYILCGRILKTCLGRTPKLSGTSALGREAGGECKEIRLDVQNSLTDGLSLALSLLHTCLELRGTRRRLFQGKWAE